MAISMNPTAKMSSPAKTPSASSIRHIPSADVHRITSGQVVLDLQTAVKELVENSLDAKATNIEVRFKNYGAESIEVIDNGSGIDPNDYESVALKHFTSKLSTLADISQVQTFGFRGEALSSLCALGHVTMHTASAKDAPIGTVLELDSRGAVVSKEKKAARQRGTSVTVTGLFDNLPVRRREFEKNLKREFSKAQTLLQAYALHSQGVRWTVNNVPKGGRKTLQLSVNSSTSEDFLTANIAALFGSKLPATLSPLDLELDISISGTRGVKKRRRLSLSDVESDDDEGKGDDEDLQEAPSCAPSIRVRGLISRPAPGCGRASSDRQFIYINGRPCEAPKIARAFNEVYRSFNTNQVPVIVANFQLPTDSYDVNVSPDKRTIFLHGESKLLDALKSALDTFFAPSRSTFAVDGASATQRTQSTQSKLDFQPADRRRPLLSSDSLLDEDDGEGEDGVVQDAEEHGILEEDGKSDNGSVGDKAAQKEVDTSTHHAEFISSDEIVQSSHSTEVRHHREPPLAATSNAAQGTTITQSFSASARPKTPSSPTQSSIGILYSHSPGKGAVQRGQAAPDIRGLYAGVESVKRRRSSFQSNYDMQHRKKRVESKGVNEAVDRIESSPAPAEAESGLRRRLEYQEEDSDEPSFDTMDDESAVDEQDNTMHTEPEEESGDAIAGKAQESESPSGGGSEVEAAPSLTEKIGHSRRASSPSEVGLSTEELQERARNLTALDETSTGTISDTAQMVSATAHQRVTDETSAGGFGLRVPFSLSALQKLCTSRANALRALPDVRMLSSQLPGSPRKSDAADNALVDEDLLLAGAAGVAEQDSDKVERALSRVLHKEDFARMEVLGQFNKGFIIARRKMVVKRRASMPDEAAETRRNDGKLVEEEQYTDDLFIIDQHASDEKYNFETLQRETRIRPQLLIRPRTLELSASDEMVVSDHIETLKNNGFEVKIDEETPAGSRARLLSQPVSKGVVFGLEDLEELLHLLRDVHPASPAALTVRCSKARAMFASRACRKSVMIGDALNVRQMRSIVDHMGTIEQPWNCPHGRPTMRHLVSLDAQMADIVLGAAARGSAHREVDWDGLGALE